MKIITEIANAHDGSLGTAFAFIDAAASAGVDAVKFQCHTGDPVAEFRPGTWFPQDKSRQDYWKRVSFSSDQWCALAGHARERGLQFGVSCFSAMAFEMMNGVGVDFWKVGAGQVDNRQLIRAMARSRKPLILSSGMSDWKELDGAIEAAAIEQAGELTVLQCTSEYPCPPDKVGLNVLAEMRKRYHCKVGLSDHSGVIYPGIVAASQGADLLEVHLCLSRFAFGPDVPASLTPEELGELVQAVRYVEQMKPVDKDAMASEMEQMRRLFRCSA